MLQGCVMIAIQTDTIEIQEYPFAVSLAYQKRFIPARDIDDCNPAAYPPTIRVGKELIFLAKGQENILEAFAFTQNIPIVDRPWIWD